MEHTALAKAVLNTIQKDLGVDVDDVIAFLSDSASVMKAVYDNHLKDVFYKSVWVRCLSHGINNVAKVCLVFFLCHIISSFQ